jgi:ProP effector
MRTNRQISRIAQATATIGVFAAQWPRCFAVYERRRQPLKVGIHRDILAAAAGAITPDEVRIALRRYCGSAGYLFALRESAARIDLAGNVAGVVTADEAVQARKVLAERREREAAKRRARPTAAHQTNTEPRRLSLADLRAAAHARREAAS